VSQDAASFGARLRACREAAGLSQEDLAVRSGMSARTVGKLEQERTRWPYRETVQRLADALELRDQARADFVAAAGRRRGRASSAAAGESAPPGTGPSSAMVPRQLPGIAAHFTGRAAELKTLDAMLERANGQRQGTMVISAIGGTAGVGKTALAVHWAHQVAEQFPDGQLYINLRGYDPAQPVSAADALARFLRELGVPGQDIPSEPDERATRFRSLLAGKRMLVVLDNAGSAEQVRPLLPGDSGCTVLVTSRDSLAGLAATDGARRLELDLLPLADAVALLGSLIGPRADDDPGVAADLAELCARLPLALRIAAELAVARRPAPLRELVAELSAGRLDSLDAGEDRADVRAVFSWSLRQLPEDVARIFTLISLHPGEDLDVHALAALADLTVGQARRAMARLHRVSLIQTAGRGRYTMHDLLRAYAREQAAAHDTGGSCRQALTRLFDYYLAAAAAAMDVAFPSDAHHRPRIAATTADLPALAGLDEARAWLDQERANLVAVVVHSSRHGWPRHTTALAATVRRYLLWLSYLSEADIVYSHALRVARESGDLAAEASALNGLGGSSSMGGRFRDAAAHYQAALEQYRRCGDLTGQGQVLANLGITERQLNNHASAADFYRQAQAAFEDAGDHLGTASALSGLARAEIQLGSLHQASGHLQLALQTFREEQDHIREADVLSALGEVSLRRDDLPEAATCHEMALAIFRRMDLPSGIAVELQSLAEIGMRQGHCQQAISYLRQALTLFRQVGSQHGEIHTLRTLAEALQGAGDSSAARAELTTALRLATATGSTYQQANAHRDLAESHYGDGQDDQARHHWRQALTLYTQLGTPEADQVRTSLSTHEAKKAELQPDQTAS